MGKDEQRNLLRLSSRIPDIIEYELLRGCDSAIDKTRLFAMDEVNVNKPRDLQAGSVSNLERDLKCVNFVGNLHSMPLISVIVLLRFFCYFLHLSFLPYQKPTGIHQEPRYRNCDEIRHLTPHFHILQLDHLSDAFS